jgi:hypothetical protein
MSASARSVARESSFVDEEFSTMRGGHSRPSPAKPIETDNQVCQPYEASAQCSGASHSH